MRVSASLVLRTVIAATLFSTTSLVHAADDDSYASAMRYVSLDVGGDNADSRQYSGTGSFTIGKNVWLQGTLGKLTDSSSNSLGDLSNYGAGMGFKTEHLQLKLNFSSYKNDAAYKQRDVTAALDWNEERFSVGLDLFHRNTDNSVDTIKSRRAGGTAAVHIDENFTGNGYGLHSSLALTDNLEIQAGAMKYTYDSSYQLYSRTNPLFVDFIVNNFPSLADLFYLNHSGLTRSLALLDNSYNLGLSYQFSWIGLNAQYLRDKALDTGDITNTYTLGALIFVGDHWMLSPSIGQSKSDTAGSVTFGGLSVSYNW